MLTQCDLVIKLSKLTAIDMGNDLLVINGPKESINAILMDVQSTIKLRNRMASEAWESAFDGVGQEVPVSKVKKLELNPTRMDDTTLHLQGEWRQAIGNTFQKYGISVSLPQSKTCEGEKNKAPNCNRSGMAEYS